MRSDAGDYLLKLSILGPKFSESPCTRQQHRPTIAKTVLSAKLFYCVIDYFSQLDWGH